MELNKTFAPIDVAATVALLARMDVAEQSYEANEEEREMLDIYSVAQARVAKVRCAKCEMFTLAAQDPTLKGDIPALRQHLHDVVAVKGYGSDYSVLSTFAWQVVMNQGGDYCKCYGHSEVIQRFAHWYVARERARQNGKPVDVSARPVYNGKTNETCGKCGGKGIIDAFLHVRGGVCTSCDGTGKNPWYEAPKLKVKTISREEWLAMKARPVAESVETFVTLDQKETVAADEVTYTLVDTKAGKRWRTERNGKFVKWASKAEIIVAGLSF